MIEVNNLTTNKISEAFFKKVAEKILKKEKKRKINLSIVLIGQERIKALNKRYRGKERAADVLAFPYNDSGEIVICPKEVKKNAKKFKSTYKKELTRVLIHGILHLLGYVHGKSKVKAKKMREKEEYYLSKV